MYIHIYLYIYAATARFRRIFDAAQTGHRPRATHIAAARNSAGWLSDDDEIPPGSAQIHRHEPFGANG